MLIGSILYPYSEEELGPNERIVFGFKSSSVTLFFSDVGNASKRFCTPCGLFIASVNAFMVFTPSAFSYSLNALLPAVAKKLEKMETA